MTGVTAHREPKPGVTVHFVLQPRLPAFSSLHEHVLVPSSTSWLCGIRQLFDTILLPVVS